MSDPSPVLDGVGARDATAPSPVHSWIIPVRKSTCVNTMALTLAVVSSAMILPSLSRSSPT